MRIRFLTEAKNLNPKIMHSSMVEREELPLIVRFKRPMKVVVRYDLWAPRVAEDVLEIREGKRGTSFSSGATLEAGR
jgi:hypothetical protein